MSRFLSERLAALSAYVPGEQPKDMHKLIKLNTNESPYPPSPAVLSAVAAKDVERLRLYSDLAAQALVLALAEDLCAESHQIALGNGSDEVLYFAMMAFGGSGVAFADITYGFYPVWAKLLGIEERIIPLAADFSVDAGDYIGNDRMIMIANPNAPTGMALDLPDIERILRNNPDQVVLVDEAYVDFGVKSAVCLIDGYDNLLVSRTFSKSRQMAGARLGFLVGSRALIEDVEKIRYSINPYNVNSLTQKLGAASVRDHEYFDWARTQIIQTRERTAKTLSQLGCTVLPSSANFLFVNANALSGSDYMQALRRENILVRHFNAPRIRDFVRITIGTDEQMDALCAVTRSTLFPLHGGTDA